MDNVKSLPFVDELRCMSTLDKFESADRDLNAYLMTKKKRVRKHGLEITETFPNLTGEAREIPKVKQYRDAFYNISQESLGYGHEITVKKNGRKLFYHASSKIMMENSVVDLVDPKNLPEDSYSCPNCGNLSKADVLAKDGCSFCGTHFELPQLFPKVSSYTYREVWQDDTKLSYKPSTRDALIAGAVIYLIELFVSFLFLIENRFDFSVLIPFWFVALILLGVGVLATWGLSYNIRSTVSLFSHNKNAIKENKIGRADDASSRQFEEAMRKYSPNFNFEYFSSKVYNLIGTLIFAESEQETPFYAGPEVNGFFDKFFEFIPYGIKLFSFKITEDKQVVIDLSVFADTYAYINDSVQFRKTELRFVVKKNLNYPMKYIFSPHAFNCSGCGAAYDAIKSPNCPFCGAKSNIRDYDWYIDSGIKISYPDMSLIGIHKKI